MNCTITLLIELDSDVTCLQQNTLLRHTVPNIHALCFLKLSRHEKCQRPPSTVQVVTGVYLTDIGTIVMYCDVDVAPFRMTARNVASLRLVGTSRTFVREVARFDHAAGRV
jgi:hypothetical protein